jgi:hypothetical protein
MPIGADPDETIPVCLTVDRDKPEESRPTFFIRFVTDRESRKMSRLFVDAATIADPESPAYDPEKAATMINEAVLISLAGWRNVIHRGKAVPFGTELADFLSGAEVWELADLAIRTPKLTEQDKKKSVLQSASPTANSAKDAPPRAAASKG